MGFIKWLAKILLGFTVLVIVLKSCEPTEEEKAARKEAEKLEIDTAFEVAKSLPATDACANLKAYQDLIDLEAKYRTSFYSDQSANKLNAYSVPCEEQLLMVQEITDREMLDNSIGVSDKKRKVRNQYLSKFANTFLVCKSAKLTDKVTKRSQPLYIITGNFYDTTYARSPSNDYEDYEILIRLAKPEKRDLTYYETFQQSLLDGSISEYRYGTSEVSLEEYGIGSWDLERDSLILKRTESKSVDASHSSIGDFVVDWYITVQYRCSKESLSSLPDFLDERQASFSRALDEKNRVLDEKKRLEAIKDAEALKARQDAQRERNRI